MPVPVPVPMPVPMQAGVSSSQATVLRSDPSPTLYRKSLPTAYSHYLQLLHFHPGRELGGSNRLSPSPSPRPSPSPSPKSSREVPPTALQGMILDSLPLGAAATYANGALGEALFFRASFSLSSLSLSRARGVHVHVQEQEAGTVNPPHNLYLDTTPTESKNEATNFPTADQEE